MCRQEQGNTTNSIPPLLKTIDKTFFIYGGLVQRDERMPYKHDVIGSTPISPTTLSSKEKNGMPRQVKEFGYRGTGKIYGVSDNAIRKWLKTA